MLSSGDLDLRSGTWIFFFYWRTGCGIWGSGSDLWDLGLLASDFRIRDLYTLTPDQPPLRPLRSKLETMHEDEMLAERASMCEAGSVEKLTDIVC